MSEIWYREKHYGNRGEIETLEVLSSTKHFLNVVDKHRKNGVRRESKSGAASSLLVCLMQAVERAKAVEERARDYYSRAVQLRKEMERQLAVEVNEREAQSAGEAISVTHS